MKIIFYDSFILDIVTYMIIIDLIDIFKLKIKI